MPHDDKITAAVLVIGDEVLSGRTKDRNIGYIADYLTAIGVDLKEVRIVPDDEPEIIRAVNALRQRYTYLFTTGGIGPTHDDITADSVAKAFDVGIDHNPEAVRILLEHFKAIGREANEMRMRMARIPDGAELIDNPVSKAPGFHIGNVFVLAGVPKIMQAMLDGIAPQLRRGAIMLSRTIRVDAAEGDIARPLADIQSRHHGVVIGSYPFEEDGRFGSNIVLRSRDETSLNAAATEVDALAVTLTGTDLPPLWS